jgi:hypothetical protein
LLQDRYRARTLSSGSRSGLSSNRSHLHRGHRSFQARVVGPTQPNPYEDPGSPETPPPRSGWLTFLPRCLRPSAVPLWQRVPSSCPSPGARPGLHHTRLEGLASWGQRVPRPLWGTRRPRNRSVPSSRPRPRGGGRGAVRPCVSGSGTGQHTSTRHD